MPDRDLFEAIIDDSPIGIAVVDRELRYLYVNDHLAVINGIPAGKIVGRTLAEVLGDLAAEVERFIRGVLATGRALAVDRLLGAVPARPQDQCYFNARYFPLRDQNGVVTHVACHVIDITAQVAAEDERDRAQALLTETARAELERGRIQLEQAQTIAQLGSWEADLLTGEVIWSRQLRRTYGVDDDYPASYQAFLALVHPDDRTHVAEVTGRSGITGQPVDYEYRIVRPNGEVRVVAGRNRTLVERGGRPAQILGTAQDITEHKALEARLLASDRMAALGNLAAGLAHEINNPLAYTLGNVDLALEGLAAVNAELGELPVCAAVRARLETFVTTQRELLRVASEGGSRVRTIVRDMRVFARGDATGDGEVDLRAVVESSATLAANEIRHRARLRIAHGPTPRVVGNQSRLGQVVLNLIINAAHAIKEGSPAEHEIRIGTYTGEDGRAVLEVTDTGVGIPRELLGRIFDPFFTTKPIGTGSGLGLSICHGIVESAGGEILVDSEVGRGTRVRVMLPVAAPLEPAPPIDAQPAPRRPRVLIVDDEPQVVAFSRRCLAPFCEVVALVDASEALDHIISGSEFDLILCDVMMPKMSGIDLFERVLADRPSMAGRFVFMSGGAFTQRAQEFLESGHPRLDKPFAPPQLRALVESRLAHA